MERLVSQSKIVGILSNSTQLAAKEMNKLSRHGILEKKHYHFLITSGEIARNTFLNGNLPFAAPRRKFWTFYGSHPKYSSHQALFEGTPYVETPNVEDADFIYIGVPHIHGEDRTDPEAFKEEVALLKKTGLPMVCANPDLFAHEGNPPRGVVRQGAIAKLYEDLGGKVHYIGKPYAEAFSSALNCFNRFNIFDRQEILMVGDLPETDIRGAREFGISSALIMQTGMMADRIGKHGIENAIGKLPVRDHPDYFIGRLAHGI